MSFRPLEPKRTWSGSVAAVRCSVAQTKSGAVLRLILSASLLKKEGWEAAERFTVQIGEGDSAGRLRFAPATIGDVDSSFKAGKLPHGSGVRLTLHGVPGLPTEAAAARNCLHFQGVDDRRCAFIEVTLPPFAAAAPPRAKPNPSPAPLKSQERPAVAPPPRLTIASDLLTILATKAGIAFGCTRQEIFNPLDIAAIDAQAVVAMWLKRRGYAEAAIARALKLETFAEAEEAAAALVEAPARAAKQRRFETLAEEAVRHAGMAA